MGRNPTHSPWFERMIVVAVIAILAAIALPSLLRSRIAANEASAVALEKWGERPAQE